MKFPRPDLFPSTGQTAAAHGKQRPMQDTLQRRGAYVKKVYALVELTKKDVCVSGPFRNARNYGELPESNDKFP